MDFTAPRLITNWTGGGGPTKSLPTIGAAVWMAAMSRRSVAAPWGLGASASIVGSAAARICSANTGSNGSRARVIEDRSRALDEARWKPYRNVVHVRLGAVPSARVNVH